MLIWSLAFSPAFHAGCLSLLDQLSSVNDDVNLRSAVVIAMALVFETHLKTVLMRTGHG